MRLIIFLLKPYMPKIHVGIINRLLADNDRLNREWKEKYAAMEREMWYWHDKYLDDVVYDKDS